MHEQFADYLQAIDFTEAAYLERLDQALSVLTALLPAREIVAIVIEDSMDVEGNRTYLHLCALTDTSAAFADNFLHAGVFSVAPHKSSTGWRATTQDFTPGETTKDSRLRIDVARADAQWTWEVTGANCQHAWDTFVAHVVPQLI